MCFEYETFEVWWWIIPLVCIGLFVLCWILFGRRFCGMWYEPHEEKLTDAEELKEEIKNCRMWYEPHEEKLTDAEELKEEIKNLREEIQKLKK